MKIFYTVTDFLPAGHKLAHRRTPIVAKLLKDGDAPELVEYDYETIQEGYVVKITRTKSLELPWLAWLKYRILFGWDNNQIIEYILNFSPPLT